MKYIIILAFLFTGYTCHALDLDIGIGYTKTEMPHNGLWWQEPFEKDIDRESPSGHIGIRYSYSDNIKLLTGIQYLGEFKSYAKASASDHNYALYQQGEAEIWPLSTWKGKGKAYGLYGLVEYHFKHFHITGGAWVHKSEWKVDIPDWRGAIFDEQYEYGYTYSEPKPKSVDNDSDYEIGYIFGIGKQFGSISINFKILDTKGSGDFPATYLGESQNLSITYTF